MVVAVVVVGEAVVEADLTVGEEADLTEGEEAEVVVVAVDLMEDEEEEVVDAVQESQEYQLIPVEAVLVSTKR